MINFIKEQLAIRRFKRNLRIYTQPDRAFLRSAREKFITLSRQRGKETVLVGHPILWRYATVAMMALFAMTSGMAVFADANNVSVNNPLYNLKRLSEDVRLELSPPEKKLELHKVLVQRRLKEVIELSKEEPLKESTASLKMETAPVALQKNIASKSAAPVISPKKMTSRQVRINKLDSDFQKQAESVLDQAQKLRVKKESHISICKEMIMAANKEPASSSSRFLSKVQTRCGEVIDNQKD